MHIFQQCTFYGENKNKQGIQLAYYETQKVGLAFRNWASLELSS